MKLFFTLFFVFALSFTAFSQEVNLNTEEYYLVLNKPGRKKRIRFYKGEELKFKRKYENFKRTAIITDIDSTGITINNAVHIPLEDFKSIKTEKNGYWNNMARAASYSGTGMGILFITLGGVFKLAGNDQYGNSGLTMGTSLLITGQIMRLFTFRNYKLNTYRTLRAVPYWQGVEMKY